MDYETLRLKVDPSHLEGKEGFILVEIMEDLFRDTGLLSPRDDLQSLFVDTSPDGQLDVTMDVYVG